MGYRRTHFSALLISTLTSLLSQCRRGKPNCKLAESDLEEDTGWPVEPICSEVSLFQLDLDGQWGQTEHSCRLILRDRTGLFLHCIFSRLYLITTRPPKNEFYKHSTFLLQLTVEDLYPNQKRVEAPEAEEQKVMMQGEQTTSPWVTLVSESVVIFFMGQLSFTFALSFYFCPFPGVGWVFARHLEKGQPSKTLLFD